MKISTRVTLTFLLVAGVGFYFLLDWIVADLTPRYRESTEEPLVDLASVLAAQLSVTAKDGIIDPELLRTTLKKSAGRAFHARIYNFEKTSVDLRVYVTNDKGIVLFDSDNGRDEGKDYSTWRDVSLTLAGQYGARTSRDTPDAPSSTMYVAAPITSGDRIIGVMSVGKPTENTNQLIQAAKEKVFKATLLVFLAVILVAALLSFLVTRPIRRLTEYARAVRDGKRVPLPKLGSGEIGLLGTTFEEMREALEGKRYVEKYVQTLTHEIKSPLSGIRGAVELLREDLPPEKRTQFLGNIERETRRLQSLVEKLLNLSSLQRKVGVSEAESFSFQALVDEVVGEHHPSAEAKALTINVRSQGAARVRGEKFWLKEAVANLLQNALDFSPRGSSIDISITEENGSVRLEVSDRGAGIPEWALGRIFEQFYSLPRPDSGKKSTGLGLPLVREVMDLHGGTIDLRNRSEGGVCATLHLPQELRATPT